MVDRCASSPGADLTYLTPGVYDTTAGGHACLGTLEAHLGRGSVSIRGQQSRHDMELLVSAVPGHPLLLGRQ